MANTKTVSDNKKARFNYEIIENMSGQITGKEIFICAPPAMIRSLKKQFISKGVNKKLIHSEEFSL